MEHLPPLPRGPVDLDANLRFLTHLEQALTRHRVFDHPFLQALGAGAFAPPVVAATFAQFAHVVRPFTGLLGDLIGRAPDVDSRYLLLDNLYEELGHGDPQAVHAWLYDQLLREIGVTALPRPLPALRRLDTLMRQTIRHQPFAAGLAMLGLGGELPIPNNFAYLSAGLARAFPGVDREAGFFGRHGPRDADHTADTNQVLARVMQPGDQQRVARAAFQALEGRARVWDALAQASRASNCALARNRGAGSS